MILVIDDDAAVRDAFLLALEDEPHDVLVAESGMRGIELAREQRPDLVFLDLRMPELSGVDTMHRLFEDDPTLDVYVVTAFAKEYLDELNAARDAGLRFDLAAKPLRDDQIRQIAAAKLS